MRKQQEVVDAYQSGQRPDEISKLTGYPVATVYRILKRKGVPLRDRKEDLSGRHFGMLTVLERRDDVGGQATWLCKCDCGQTTTKSSGHLKRGISLSCGCVKVSVFQPRTKQQWLKSGRLPRVTHMKAAGDILETFWAIIIRSAKERAIVFDLSPEQAWNQFVKQEGRCALTGEVLVMPTGCSQHEMMERTASLDRVDSSKGYQADNIQWVHKRLQHAKNKMSQDEFIQMCRAVAKYHD